MPGRLHQNDAPSLTLSSGINAGDTTIPVSESISGVETPISYTINSGGANEEIVTLTTKNTSTSPSQFEDVVRGCDGTADQSHSSGEVLTHEATARDFVDKAVLQSQIQKPSSRLAAFDDFRRPDGSVGSLKSDQSWSLNGGGSASISGNLLSVSSNGNGPQTITWPTSNGFLRQQSLMYAVGSSTVGLIWAYQDASNYVAVTSDNVANPNLKIIKVVSGSTTIVTTGNSFGPTSERSLRGSFLNLTIETNRPGFESIRGFAIDESVNFHVENDSDVQSIFDNQSAVGLYCEDDGKFLRYSATNTPV
jgi:hypothetical protein